MLAIHSALWRWIKLWGVIRAYLYAKAKLRGTRPTVFDIGARDGLPPKWHLLARAGVINAVLFEPDPAEAGRLRDNNVPALVVEKALGDTQRSATLHVYRSPGLSSVREVHPDMLERYDYGDVFDEVGQVPVQLHRLDTLIDAAEVPQPHFMKIDVQGFELEVLQGLGSRLEGVIAVELEAQFDEMYRGQATFQQVYEWLFTQGFGLLAIRPHWIMGGYNVFEVNVFFARNATGLTDEGRRLLDFWMRVNRISSPELMAIRGY